jgi:hypothetical protein
MLRPEDKQRVMKNQFRQMKITFSQESKAYTKGLSKSNRKKHKLLTVSREP